MVDSTATLAPAVEAPTAPAADSAPSAPAPAAAESVIHLDEIRYGRDQIAANALQGLLSYAGNQYQPAAAADMAVAYADALLARLG